jgi:hypothetical protein
MFLNVRSLVSKHVLIKAWGRFITQTIHTDELKRCAGYDLSRRKGEGMTSGTEHVSWGDAVLPCESTPSLICEVLTRNQLVSRRLSTSLTPACWDVEAKDGGLSGLRSPDTNYSIVSHSINRLTGTDGRPMIYKHTSVTDRHNGPLLFYRFVAAVVSSNSTSI